MDRRRAVRKRVDHLCRVIKRSSLRVTKKEEKNPLATLDVEAFLNGLNELEDFSATEIYSTEGGGGGSSKVYVGGLDDACNFAELKRRDIGTIINCAGAQCALARLQADVVGGPNPYKDVRFQEEYYKGKLGGHIEYVSIAAEDMPRYPIEKHFDEVAMCVDRGIANGHSVFIHCMQGYNRSCALLCAWLCGGIRGPRMSLCEAVELLASRRQHVLSNRGFLGKLVEAYWPPSEEEIKRSVGPLVDLYGEHVMEAPIDLVGEVKECATAGPMVAVSSNGKPLSRFAQSRRMKKELTQDS
ncbi:map kinase phosphatase, putative [Perkinsus marinus ATCC 50983]|uniref:Map kinase phosphatase, putative n=1 Tax=Perkinsus marinus (strain ATCC 50983 / TXsc) TaxID=423536 RepID=C5KTL0_PERM5|nr:map kinase phosphatase, putative [Perkinsus marinus ATCC 50983]EER12189.1 map kinase phosphatase, putative [Perkinsus marinus ATCC 50983]|eukprot:XP_002780394.1 map kinase phosphatase, putative [Perkinsus marinus ATCC 50983]